MLICIRHSFIVYSGKWNCSSRACQIIWNVFFFLFSLLHCRHMKLSDPPTWTFSSVAPLQQGLLYFCFLPLCLHLSHSDCTSPSLPSLTLSSLSWSMIMNITPLCPFISVTVFIRIKIKTVWWCVSRNLLQFSADLCLDHFSGPALCRKPELPLMCSGFYMVVS